MKIMEAGGEYTGQMGKYPVINLTLKSAKQGTFESAYYKIRKEIAAEFSRHKEGLNHLNIISVLDRQYSEHFGFTEPEVLDMMICAVRERIYGISFFSQAILQKQVSIFKNLRFI